MEISMLTRPPSQRSGQSMRPKLPAATPVSTREKIGGADVDMEVRLKATARLRLLKMIALLQGRDPDLWVQEFEDAWAKVIGVNHRMIEKYMHEMVAEELFDAVEKWLLLLKS